VDAWSGMWNIVVFTAKKTLLMVWMLERLAPYRCF
jgi:hypothetical protein